MARRTKWKRTAGGLAFFKTGQRPYVVTVRERKAGGPLYARTWDPTARGGEGNWEWESLGHRDKQRAESYALELTGKLGRGADDLSRGKVTLAQVLALYLEHRTPRKSATEQKADKRREELWARVLGKTKDPYKLSMGEWERFIDARRSGAIDARGNAVPSGERRPVRDRTVEEDCLWLRQVFAWAARWRTASGNYLMRENPARGFDAPQEANPRRPVASQDRYEAVRGVSDQVVMGKGRSGRSYLSELLDIVNGTGRRISAVCQLRYEDLQLSSTGQAPHGAIRWPAATDKMGHETVAPLDPITRKASDRILCERPGIGAAPLFPSPENPAVAMTRHLADKWLRKAEKLAGLEKQKGSLWHAYRRKWATERKHRGSDRGMEPEESAGPKVILPASRR